LSNFCNHHQKTAFSESFPARSFNLAPKPGENEIGTMIAYGTSEGGAYPAVWVLPVQRGNGEGPERSGEVCHNYN
jgi:hypothetical protein